MTLYRFFLFILVTINFLSCKTSRLQKEDTTQDSSDSGEGIVINPPGSKESPQFQLIHIEDLAQASLDGYTKRWFKPAHRTQVIDDIAWEDRSLGRLDDNDFVLRSYVGTPPHKNRHQIVRVDKNGNFLGKPKDKEFKRILETNKIQFDEQSEINRLILQNPNYYQMTTSESIAVFNNYRTRSLSFDSNGNLLNSSRDVDSFMPNNKQGIIVVHNSKDADEIIKKIQLYRPDVHFEIIDINIKGDGKKAIILKVDEENTFNNSIKSKEEENEEILESALSRISESSKKEPYGGDAGRHYFKERFDRVIEPSLIDSLNGMKGKSQNPGSVSLVRSLFYDLGQERKYIAETVSVGNGIEGMGSIQGRGFMLDPINQRSFPNWHTELQNQIQRTIPIWRSGDPRTLEEFTENLQKVFVGSKVEAVNLENYIRHLATLNREGDFEFLKITSNESSNFGDLILAFPKDTKNLTVDDITLTMMHKEFNEHTFEKLSPYFYKALNATKEEELKDALAMLLLRISHETVYARGQAAISVWLLKGIAKANRFDLKFSSKWEGPGALNPDMHALSTFSDKQFMQEFRENVTLKPWDNTIDL